MEFMYGLFAVYFLLTIRPFFRYFRCKKIQGALSSEINALKSEIAQLKKELSAARKQAADDRHKLNMAAVSKEQGQNVSSPPKVIRSSTQIAAEDQLKLQLQDVTKNLQEAIRKNAALTADCKQYISSLVKTEKELHLLQVDYARLSGKKENALCGTILSQQGKLNLSSYGHDPQSTWGELWNQYGKVKESLTPDQKALIHYPRLNTEAVFHTPFGKSFHSVFWCYTIEHSYSSFTLEEADAKGYKPCSKCVSPDQLRQYRALHGEYM